MIPLLFENNQRLKLGITNDHQQNKKVLIFGIIKVDKAK